MEQGLYKFITKYSARDQIILIFLSLLALPFLYLTFELPKRIVNEALATSTVFPKTVLGNAFGQVDYLVLLCGMFLGLVLVNGGLKYFSSTYRYRVGDQLLRRLRYGLVENLLRFPITRLKDQPTGQVVSMVAAETSSLGLFMSEAFTVPTVALGTLGTVLLFIFVQDWMMGLAALALYPIQIWLVPKIQTRINDLQRKQFKTVRGISDHVGELIVGAPEIHGHDTAQFELASITKRLRKYYELNVQISSARYLVNILNQFFSQLTPFFFLLIGGYLVIQGEFSLGSLVAVLAAHKDMYAPWKDLIDYYQKAQDARVKYDQLFEFFQHPSLLPASVLSSDVPQNLNTCREITFRDVSTVDDSGLSRLEKSSLRLTLPVHAGFWGGTGAAREDLARLLTRQTIPSMGEITINDQNLQSLPDSVLGRLIASVGPENFVGSGTLRESMTYPLRRRQNGGKRNPEVESATLGSSSFDPEADWLDYSIAGCEDGTTLIREITRVLQLVGLRDDVLDIGLRQTVNQSLSPLVTSRLLQAREAMRVCFLANSELARVIEQFEPDSYIDNGSIAENILFGVPISDAYSFDSLAAQPHFRQVLDQTGLTKIFVQGGLQLAKALTEIFRELSPDSDLVARFSLARPDEIHNLELLLRDNESLSSESISQEATTLLISIFIRVVAASDALNLVTPGLKSLILQARERFRLNSPTDITDSIQVFDGKKIMLRGGLSENILFGKLRLGVPESNAVAFAALRKIVSEQAIEEIVIDLGLNFNIGVGGSRLTSAQRQRLALARALIKRPQMLIWNGALSSLDKSSRTEVLVNIKKHMHGRTLLSIDAEEPLPSFAEKPFIMRSGRIVEESANLLGDVSQIDEGDHDQTELSGELGQLVELMAGIPILSSISKARLKLLAFTSDRSSYEDGEVVFRQGSQGDRAYIILDGTAEIYLEADGKNTVIAKLVRHQVFGEMALLGGISRTTSVRAAGRLELIGLRQDVFVKLVEETPVVSMSIIKTLVSRLGTTTAELSRVRQELKSA
ncbi:MAG: cyclic nucleotide-binding domain-containing protein [Gammaproteobacteria bacterium]|nr:cyclic nucleotide-binding domain-containing protein [Gammaproteobacteria bacterium]